jgi:hypothetical protein
VTDTPEFDEFKKELAKLKTHKLFKQVLTKQELHLAKLTLEEVATLLLQDVARYFLLAAANLNRTQLKKAAQEPETAMVAKKLRQAHAVQKVEAERYRAGAEAFIDRLFFQEEIEECIEYLREAAKISPDTPKEPEQRKPRATRRTRA